jgi:quercetin dioxygenase-like cupin family protein
MPHSSLPAAQNGEYLWFLNSLVRIGVPSGQGVDGLCVMEHRVPHGDSPPLHRHATEDEFFHILDGEFRFVVDGQSRRAGPGAMLLAPKGSLHTYRAESPEGGRFVTVTRGHDFEQLVLALGRPAERLELPPPAGPPSPEALAELGAAAAERGITFHGPPLGPEESAA